MSAVKKDPAELPVEDFKLAVPAAAAARGLQTWRRPACHAQCERRLHLSGQQTTASGREVDSEFRNV